MRADKYATTEAAAAYRAKFRRSPWRRLSDWRERRLLGRLLARLGPVESVLDCPCGAGRTLPQLAAAAPQVFGADRFAAMARAARVAAPAIPLALADARALPWADGAVDVVVCWRLLHHFPAPERARILAEAARVARRAVVVSFADAGTRRARRSRTRRHAVPADGFAAEAAAAGLTLEPPVLRVGGAFSFQAFALLARGCSAPFVSGTTG